MDVGQTRARARSREASVKKRMGEKFLKEALAVLEKGGLVIIPTETFYGIACDARSTEAVNRLIRIKGREEGKPIPLIAGSTEVARKSASSLPEVYKVLAREFWPGALTMVLPSADGFPAPITAGTRTIGIRIPGPSFALDLAKAFQGPVTATSANTAGQPPARMVEEIDQSLIQSVDLVIDGGKTPGGEPSTVLDLTVDPPEILRPGALYKEVVEFLEKMKQKRIQKSGARNQEKDR